MYNEFQRVYEWVRYDGEGNEVAPPWVRTEKDLAAKNKIKIDRQWLYRQFCEDHHILISEKGNMFFYESGRYLFRNKREVQALIKRYLPVDYRTPWHWEEIYKEFESSPPNMKESQFDAQEGIINFTNGLLILEADRLKPHSSKYFSLRQIPCNYRPGLTLDDAPVFKQYLNDLIGNDKEAGKFLLEYIGAILSNVPGWRFKKLLVLVGEGNTGKTQLRELVMKLIGEEHCIAIDIPQIQTRFGPIQLYQKRLAGSGDMANARLDEVNLIKNLTGGDSVFAEPKGKEGFSFRYDGFLWFNANKLPYFRGDRGDHVYERFIVVRCPNVVSKEKRDPHLLDKLIEEKEAIVSVAITHLREAIAQGYEFTESETMRWEREKYVIANNSLLTFVKSCCVFGDYNLFAWELNLSEPKKKKMLRSKFHQVYKKWCQLNDVKPERLKDIPAQMEKHFGLAPYKTGGEYVYDISLTENAIDELGDDYDSYNQSQSYSRKY